jgi:hypothetical protein
MINGDLEVIIYQKMALVITIVIKEGLIAI